MDESCEVPQIAAGDLVEGEGYGSLSQIRIS